MKVLQLLWAHLGHWYHSVALRQINVMHPDVPYIVHRKLYYSEQLKELHS